MKVHLKQVEIVQALKQYLSAQGIAVDGKTVEVSFTAGRKESGLTAEVNITSADDQPVAISRVSVTRTATLESVATLPVEPATEPEGQTAAATAEPEAQAEQPVKATPALFS